MERMKDFEKEYELIFSACYSKGKNARFWTMPLNVIRRLAFIFA